MKIYYQIASSRAQDWQVVDSSNWANLGDLHINALCVQGDVWCGSDLYGVRNLENGSVEIAGIHDSHDWLPGSRWVRVIRYIPLHPDPRPEYGGAINSYKTTTIYADKFKNFNLHKNDPLFKFLPWHSFNKNLYACKHGIWLSDENYTDLERFRRECNWREWGDHLPSEELDSDGLVLDQSTLGRKVKPKGTQTFILTTDTTSLSAHTPQVQLQMRKEYLAENTVSATDITGDEVLFSFISTDGAPWAVQWPTSGTYRCQLDVSSATSDLSYGLLNHGSYPGHFGRVNRAVTSCLQSVQQSQSVFTGSGLKLASITDPSWSSGSHFDRLEILISGTRTTGHSKQSITLRLNRPDDYVDGPWEPIPCVTQAMHLF